VCLDYITITGPRRRIFSSPACLPGISRKDNDDVCAIPRHAVSSSLLATTRRVASHERQEKNVHPLASTSLVASQCQHAELAERERRSSLLPIAQPIGSSRSTEGQSLFPIQPLECVVALSKSGSPASARPNSTPREKAGGAESQTNNASRRGATSDITRLSVRPTDREWPNRRGGRDDYSTKARPPISYAPPLF
jgi:hypothetical protein